MLSRFREYFYVIISSIFILFLFVSSSVFPVNFALKSYLIPLTNRNLHNQPVYASSIEFLKFCFASHSHSSSLSAISIRSILKITGRVPSLQQAIIIRSSFGHHSSIIRPSLHDRATLQSGVNISADSIPRLSAELAIHQVIKIVLLRCAF